MSDKGNTLQDRLDVLSEQIRGLQFKGERVPLRYYKRKLRSYLN